VNHEEDAGKVKRCGKDSSYKDVGVGITCHFCHKECSSAHDRRHYLTAGGSSSLNCTCKLAGVAGLLHKGNGYRTGGNGVANRGTGNHAAECGGDNRNLCGAAGSSACKGVGAVDEEVGNAGRFKECTEDNEKNYISRANADGGAYNAGGGIEQVIDNCSERLACAEECIKHKRGSNAKYRDTNYTTAAFCKNQNAYYAESDVQRLDSGAQINDFFEVKAIIEIAECTGKTDNDIVYRNMVNAGYALLNREQNKYKQDDHAHKERTAETLVPGSEHIHPNHEQRKCCQNQSDDFLGLTFPYTNVGFAVEFLHYRVNVRCGTNLNFRAGFYFSVFGQSRFLPIKLVGVAKGCKTHN